MYTTTSGRKPVREFIIRLSDDDARYIHDGMNQVRKDGLRAARHLRDDLWEVRVSARGSAYRIIFAPEGKYGQVLLALEAINKKTQKTPTITLQVAEKRLRDWRKRAVNRRLTESH